MAKKQTTKPIYLLGARHEGRTIVLDLIESGKPKTRLRLEVDDEEAVQELLDAADRCLQSLGLEDD